MKTKKALVYALLVMAILLLASCGSSSSVEKDSSAEKAGSVNSGDIMLYGSDCLVVFFKSFDTPYSYTKIGHIDDAEGFGAARGKGTVTIGFKEEK